MKRSVIFGIAVVMLVGAGAWLLTQKKGPGTQAPSTGQTGQSGQNAGPDAGNPGARQEQFAQFQEQHKYTMQLSGLVRNIGRMEQEGQYKLTPAQAKQILGILQPLRTQPKLTQDEAKDTIRALQQVLTMNQRTEVGKLQAAAPPGGNRRGGGAGGGAGRNGGNGGPGGSGGMGGAGAPGAGSRGGPAGGRTGGDRPRFDAEAMKDYNPFNPESGGMGGPRAAARWDAFFAALEAKAK